MSEYVTLLSNSTSHGLHKNNKNYSFCTSFSEPLALNGVGKLGLYEFSFSTALESDTDLSSCIEIFSWRVKRFALRKQAGETVKIFTGYGRKITVTDSQLPLPEPRKDQFNPNKWVRLSSKDMDNAESFIGSINAVIFNQCDDLKDAKKPLFVYDPLMRKLWFNYDKAHPEFVTIRIRGEMLKKFGVCQHFEPLPIDEIIIGKNKTGSSFRFDNRTLNFNADFLEDLETQCDFRNFFQYIPHVRPSVTDLLIYTDAVTESRIGSSKVSVIKWIENDDSQVISRKCINFAQSMQYYDTSKEYLTELTIQIRDQAGRFVKLLDPVRIVLHVIHP